MNKPIVNVAIALLFHQSKVLVGWREAEQHQGNKYEFPGGKVEPDETAVEACRRETFEEVGIGIQEWHAFDVIRHEYEDLHVHLHIFHANVDTAQLGTIQRPWTWYERSKLSMLNFPKANDVIIQRLMWAKKIKISNQLTDILNIADDTLLYFRPELDLNNPSQDIVSSIECLSDQQLAYLIANIELWKKLNQSTQNKLAAIQLKQDQLFALSENQLPIGIPCIASCHDAVSLQHAQKNGCEAVFLSPVKDTTTHDNAHVLGWDGFKKLTASVEIPVFALGGLKPEDLENAQKQGAYGIAGISQF